MYCQTCGAEIQPGLNYCNRCGAQVATATTKEVLVPVDLTSPVRWVSATVGVTFLLGLITIFVALTGLASWGFNRDGVMFIAFFSLMMLGVMELSLIRLLSRLLLGQSERKRLPRFGKSKEKALREAAQPPHYMPPAAAPPPYTDPL